MRRREFIAGLAGVAAWPVAAHGQRSRVRRIGLLLPFSENDPEAQRRVAALREGLEDVGLVEDHNIEFEYRWTSARDPRPFAEELVSLSPDVILANSTPPLRALQHATRTIPIVFVAVSDPVGDGLVTNLARPGGNITGFSNFEPDLSGKWVSLLKEIAPRVAQIAILFNPNTAPHSIFLQPLEAATASLGLVSIAARVRSPAEIESALASFERIADCGLIVMPDSSMDVQRELIITLAARHRLPAIYSGSHFAKGGGLMSYGVNRVDQYRRAASYIDRILRGEKPGELPVQAPIRFDLVINRKAANALGLSIPVALLVRADEVIEG
jgi:putative tryptophan/tyrosine transport system substrate-binding protein